MLVKQVLRQQLYQINFPTSERHEALCHALNLLVGLRPEDFIKYFEELHQSTEKTVEKRRYTQDIKFIKENFHDKIKYLTVYNILRINRIISEIALTDKNILFGTNSDNEIYKIEKMIECVPKNKSIIEIAAYYLKNITILQAFSDGNHRTAILSILFFFKSNDYVFKNKMTGHNTNQLRNDIDEACFKVYGYSYNAMNIDVLSDYNSKVYSVCLDFIKKRLL